MPRLDAVELHVVAIEEEHAPAAATAEPTRLLDVAVEHETAYAEIPCAVSVDEREKGVHAAFVERHVVVVEHAVDEEQSSLLPDDRGGRFVEATGVLVGDENAHADLELLGLGHGEFIVTVPDVVNERAADAWHLEQDRLAVADNLDAGTHVQRVIHAIDAGGNLSHG